MLHPKTILVGCWCRLRKRPATRSGELAESIAPEHVPSLPVRKGRTENAGDGLGKARRKEPAMCSGRLLQPCFNNCFQGEHVGIEVAASADEGASPAGPFEDLVVDDFFVLSEELEQGGATVPAKAFKRMQTAIQAYEKLKRGMPREGYCECYFLRCGGGPCRFLFRFNLQWNYTGRRSCCQTLRP